MRGFSGLTHVMHWNLAGRDLSDISSWSIIKYLIRVPSFFILVFRYTPGSSPVMSDVSLIRLSPQRGSNLSTIPEYHYPYMPPHGYVDHLHGSPAMSVLSHARGLSPTGSHPGQYL